MTYFTPWMKDFPEDHPLSPPDPLTLDSDDSNDDEDVTDFFEEFQRQLHNIYIAQQANKLNKTLPQPYANNTQKNPKIFNTKYSPKNPKTFNQNYPSNNIQPKISTQVINPKVNKPKLTNHMNQFSKITSSDSAIFNNKAKHVQINVHSDIIYNHSNQHHKTFTNNLNHKSLSNQCNKSVNNNSPQINHQSLQFNNKHLKNNNNMSNTQQINNNNTEIPLLPLLLLFIEQLIWIMAAGLVDPVFIQAIWHLWWDWVIWFIIKNIIKIIICILFVVSRDAIGIFILIYHGVKSQELMQFVMVLYLLYELVFMLFKINKAYYFGSSKNIIIHWKNKKKY
eukprot:297862_1